MPRIARLETFADAFVCFVRVTDDEGGMGWGQTSTYHADITATIFHRLVAPHVLGQPEDDILALVQRVEEKEHKFPGSHRARALAGLDTALWDLHGCRAGKPVCALIGGTPGRVRAYASSMKRDITPEAEAARFLRLRDDHGFTAFKWRVGAECGHGRRRMAGADRGGDPGRGAGARRRDRQTGRRQFGVWRGAGHRGRTHARGRRDRGISRSRRPTGRWTRPRR